MESTTQMQQIRDQVTNVYRLYTRQPNGIVDPKTARFWVNAIMRKEKTIDDYTSILLRSEDVITALSRAFKEVFFKTIGVTMYDVSFFEDYRNTITSSSNISDDDIRTYICSLDVFVQKYKPLICDMYDNIVKSEKGPITDEVTDYFMNNFRTNETYDVDQLETDMRSHAWLHMQQNTFPAKVQSLMLPIVDVTPAESYLSCKELNDILRNLCLKGILNESYFKNLKHADVLENAKALAKNQDAVQDIKSCFSSLTLDKQFVDLFEEQMNRAIFVDEYFFYKHLLGSKSDPNEIKLLAQAQSQCFLDVRDVYENYCDTDLDEYEFVKTYLHDIHQKDVFMKRFIQDILNSSTYQSKMKALIESKYNRMYNETIEGEELEYLFDKIKNKEIHLVSDQLSQEIVEFKKETDDIINHIFGKYMKLLERQPDSFESTKYVRTYRQNLYQGYSMLDEQLETDIVQSLEYHDIIKTTIRVMYQKKFGKEIIPSKTFEVLSRCISDIYSLKNAKDIQHAIDVALDLNS